MNLEVLFTPADFAALATRDLKNTACVVLDVFRATSTMITALANGASAIIPVGEISEALAIRKREPDVLLCGEREGKMDSLKNHIKVSSKLLNGRRIMIATRTVPRSTWTILCIQHNNMQLSQGLLSRLKKP